MTGVNDEQDPPSYGADDAPIESKVGTPGLDTLADLLRSQS